MRLINADRLLTDGMKSKYYHLPNGDTAIPIIDIEDAPTIDAVPVVRCKDCKHRYGDECPMRHVEWVTYEDDGYIEWDDVVHDNTDDDGYCSYGELEDGEA